MTDNEDSSNVDDNLNIEVTRSELEDIVGRHLEEIESSFNTIKRHVITCPDKAYLELRNIEEDLLQIREKFLKKLLYPIELEAI